MKHPLHEGAGRRHDLLVCSAPPPVESQGLAQRLAQLSAASPAIIADLSDPTAHHFYYTAKSKGWPIVWISTGDVISGALPQAALCALVATVPGIYMRESSILSDDAFLATACLRAIVNHSKNRIVSSPVTTNWCKPIHMRRIAAAGNPTVTVPRSRVVSHLSSVDRGVLKAMGGMPTYAVRVLNVSGCSANGPFFVQEEIIGDEYRIHVIDGSVVAHLLGKGGRDEIDYRVSGLHSITRVQLNAAESDQMRSITSKEGLRFSGIDAIRSSGGLCVLEVNPMPGYHPYEVVAQDGIPISDALYRALAGGNTV